MNMKKIKKYVENFFKTNKGNEKYQIYAPEMAAVYDAMKINPFDAISTLFDYGYAKGYRAALAEMKKGGAVSCK